MPTLEAATRAYYESYYERRGGNRNDVRTNRGVLFQTLAQESSVIRAFASLELDPAQSRLLDVGCGDGANLFQLLRMQFEPSKIVGIDLLRDRIQRAAELYPSVQWVHGDASRMDLPSESFDVVFESTMFVTVTDDAVAAAIAQEMQRVCKAGGYIVLVDWWMQRPADDRFRALTTSRLHTLFDLESRLQLIGKYSGALAPPLGRALSRWLPAAYFAVSSLLPFAVAQGAYVLRKRAVLGTRRQFAALSRSPAGHA